MARAMIYTLDPATDEQVTLPELGRRHQLDATLMRSRYHAGLRGNDLVAPTLKRNTAARDYQPKVKPLTQHQRAEIVQEILASPQGRLAARRFKDYARAAA